MNSTNECLARNFVVYESYIDFQNGYVNGILNNNILIPIHIYGFKSDILS